MEGEFLAQIDEILPRGISKDQTSGREGAEIHAFFTACHCGETECSVLFHVKQILGIQSIAYVTFSVNACEKVLREPSRIAALIPVCGDTFVCIVCSIEYVHL